MPDSKPSAPKTTKRIPDYTGDRNHANDLARKLQDFYHKRGYQEVRVWVEPEFINSDRRIFGVRSNISFSLQNINK